MKTPKLLLMFSTFAIALAAAALLVVSPPAADQVTTRVAITSFR